MPDPSKLPLSVVMIAHNEEAMISEAVQSADFADEVLVLDSGSTDRTAELAQQLGARVEHQSWLGFGRQKQRAVELAKNDWVFVLDCDERIPEPLQSEIRSILHDPAAHGYFVPRLNQFFGKPIHFGGLYPDLSLRLFNRTKGRFDNAEVHEKVIIEGSPGRLKNPIDHLAYRRIDEFIDKQNRYSSLQNKGRHLAKAVVHSHWTFWRMYLVKQGFRDGWRGFVIARLYAQYTFWKYIKTSPSHVFDSRNLKPPSDG